MGGACKGNPLIVESKYLQLESQLSGFLVQSTGDLSNLERRVSLWWILVTDFAQDCGLCASNHSTSTTILAFKTAVTLFEWLSTYTPF